MTVQIHASRHWLELSQSLFAGDALQHKQRAAEATYKQTILNALQNITDTLKAVQADTLAMRIMPNTPL